MALMYNYKYNLFFLKENFMPSNSIIEKFNLVNDVALVTGASRGLGRRFAYVLANMGAKVVLAARNRIN